MRVLHPGAKIAVVVLGVMLAILVPLGIVSLTQGFDLAIVAILAITVALVLFCVRAFRGPSENVEAPRPWWRLTEKPTAGFVAAGWFFLLTLTWGVPALSRGAVAYGPGIATASVIVYGVLCAAFLASSIRLMRERHQGGAG